ncbi:hypothetical protein [Pseudarthrobacter sp. IC2-21]|jgi:hypothetical protein|uniref:hypothetical protein n=1 Tax=Pseudarthrobacter sp. IC2-21 TaxID=3092262 RepID=UPI002A6B32AF|nr:hypothetical protein [Pseudarthrobacter sp. IC2-21]
MLFIDPSGGKELPAAPPPADRNPVPAPPVRKPVPLTQVRPVRGRDREMQQLIHDLAVLAAQHSQQVTGGHSATGVSP